MELIGVGPRASYIRNNNSIITFYKGVLEDDIIYTTFIEGDNIIYKRHQIVFNKIKVVGMRISF